MALHSELPIYKSAYELLQAATAFIKNYPRSVKPMLGQALHDACMSITLLVAQANAAQDKVPHLMKMLEQVQVAELLIRLAMDMKHLSLTQYASAILLTDAIGKQANGWKKASSPPAAEQPRLF